MKSSRSHFPLFIAWLVALGLAAGALGLLVFLLPMVRIRAEMRALLRPRLEAITLGTLLRESQASPAELTHIRDCYEHPEAIDLDTISWNLLSRPTPYVGGAPAPGLQAEGPFNSRQMRDEREVQMPKPVGCWRVFVTGGSLAYSIGVPDHRLAISRLLEGELQARPGWADRRVESFNAAVPSWSTTHERIWIENHLSELSPDLVIMLTGTNECHWAWGGLDILNLRTYSEDEFFNLVNGAMRMAGVAQHPPNPPTMVPPPLAEEEVARRFIKNVRLAAAALEPADVPLVVALQPFLSPDAKIPTAVEKQWLSEKEIGPKSAYIERCFSLFVRDLEQLAAEGSSPNLRWVDLRGVFAGRQDPLFIDLYHVVDKGNRAIAGRLADELSNLSAPGAPPTAN